jgi:hypothetical protein
MLLIIFIELVLLLDLKLAHEGINYVILIRFTALISILDEFILLMVKGRLGFYHFLSLQFQLGLGLGLGLARTMLGLQ